MARYFLR